MSRHVLVYAYDHASMQKHVRMCVRFCLVCVCIVYLRWLSSHFDAGLKYRDGEVWVRGGAEPQPEVWVRIFNL